MLYTYIYIFFIRCMRNISFIADTGGIIAMCLLVKVRYFPHCHRHHCKPMSNSFTDNFPFKFARVCHLIIFGHVYASNVHVRSIGRNWYEQILFFLYNQRYFVWQIFFVTRRIRQIIDFWVEINSEI